MQIGDIEKIILFTVLDALEERFGEEDVYSVENVIGVHAEDGTEYRLVLQILEPDEC